MILSYGMSIIGTSHEKKGTVCQDANKVISLDNGWIIATVADGVGSRKYADIASSIAVETSIAYILDKLDKEPEKTIIKEIIKQSFFEAQLEIEKKCISENHLITDYDTTLSLVIFNGEELFYGHCGDGGIIGLTENGDYIKITEPQKKDGMFVVPLRNGESEWIFNEITDCKLSSVLLATDGVYDIFFSYLLKGQPIEVYIPLIRYFMDNNIMNASVDSISDIEEKRKHFLLSEDSASITDYKTLVVLINNEVFSKKKEASFYAEPDWEYLQSEWNKKVYPHLYKK